ncbi:MAG: hypothetical protein H3C55_11905 [Pseudorhodoplanes sp.]|nr:hypothetical protein [Pseudorhodoplanes sp.]MBW7950040.1 hypothetical protein [Pseudorhodoplanes sp.]GIK80156.1 MAG: hypothetical protein BroJett024_12610 [Alphaproteobacteria bacterium]
MIAAERTLKLRDGDRLVEIPIRVFVPERAADGTWFCRYEVGWPEGIRQSRAGGVDSAQALLLAMQMIGSEIYTSSYHRSGNLFLDAPGRGYGFPVAATLRDLLEGDDRKDAGVA